MSTHRQSEPPTPYYGHRPRVASDAFVAPTAIVIGDVTLESQASLWFGCVARGDVQRIVIGARSNIQDGTILHGTTDGLPTLIGSDVTVGHAAVLHACTLEDGCFVGIGARVLDGAIVRSGGMLAAGALLSPGKIVPRGELWGGSPARLLRPLTDKEIHFIAVSAARYAALASHYRSAPPATYSEDLCHARHSGQ